MSNSEQKPKGPWGKPENVASMDALEKTESEANRRKKEEITAVVEKLKEQVREGDEAAALKAFEEALFPTTELQLRGKGTQVDGVLMDVLVLTGQKYGWSVVNKMLSHDGIRPLADEYKTELGKRAKGWQK